MPQFAWRSRHSSRCTIHGVAWNVLAFLARWALGLGFLSLAVGLLVHVAPATSQPLPWVSLGTTIVIVWWVIVSVGFYFYLTGLASYNSVFGSLASVIVVIAYLYISTTAFLFGAQLDAIIRAQSTGTLSGVELDPSHYSQDTSSHHRELNVIATLYPGDKKRAPR